MKRAQCVALGVAGFGSGQVHRPEGSETGPLALSGKELLSLICIKRDCITVKRRVRPRGWMGRRAAGNLLVVSQDAPPTSPPHPRSE